MATLRQKIEAEQKMRALLKDNGLPAPDAVEYGQTCVRFFFEESKVVIVVDIDEPPPGWRAADELDESDLADAQAS